MRKNKELGQQGERLAAEYLEKKGWKIHEMNYRHSHQEIDLIASYGELLIFVEVKARTNIAFGLPEQFVDDEKTKNIMKAADHYLHDTNWQGNVRFDIISVIFGTSPEITHIEDAFY